MTTHSQSLPPSRAGLLGALCLALASGPVGAATTLRAAVTGKPTEVSIADSGPAAGTASAANTIGTTDRAQLSATAGFGRLSADARSLGRPPAPATVEAIALFDTDDVFLSIIDEANCADACFGFYPVSVTVSVSGSFARFAGADVPGRARADARLYASGAVYADRFGQRFSGGLVQDQALFDSDPSGNGLGSVADVLSVSFWARPGETYTVGGRLEVAAASGYGFFGERTGIVADFSSTWAFDPEQVFSVPANISVQAPSLGLADNQLPHLLTAVPLPAPAGLMVAALVILGACHQRPVLRNG